MQRQLRHDLQVLPVDAEQEIDAGRVGFADGLQVKRVDAHREPALLQPRHHGADAGKRLHRRAAEIDHVGAAGAKVLGARKDVGEGHAVGLDDLGEYLGVVLAVSLEVVLLPEERGQVLEVLGAADHRDADSGLDEGEVAPAEARDHDLVEPTGVGESPCDPLRAHERGHRPAEDGDVVREVQLEPVERPPQALGGEPAGHEQRVGHSRRFLRYPASHSLSEVCRAANATPSSSARISAIVP